MTAVRDLVIFELDERRTERDSCLADQGNYQKKKERKKRSRIDVERGGGEIKSRYTLWSFFVLFMDWCASDVEMDTLPEERNERVVIGWLTTQDPHLHWRSVEIHCTSDSKISCCDCRVISFNFLLTWLNQVDWNSPPKSMIAAPIIWGRMMYLSTNQWW